MWNVAIQWCMVSGCTIVCVDAVHYSILLWCYKLSAVLCLLCDHFSWNSVLYIAFVFFSRRIMFQFKTSRGARRFQILAFSSAMLILFSRPIWDSLIHPLYEAYGDYKGYAGSAVSIITCMFYLRTVCSDAHDRMKILMVISISSRHSLCWMAII